jgi:anti-anti-sigma factor
LTVQCPGGIALSEGHVEGLTRRLPALVAGRDGALLTLDLRGVPAVSSGALGKLLGLYRAVRAVGGRLVLVHAGAAVRRVFRITRLDTVLEVRAEESARV